MSASYFGQHSELQGFQQSDLLDCRVGRTMSCVGSAGFMWMCQLQRDSRQSCPPAGAQNSSSVHLGIRAYAQVVITRHGRDVVSFCKWGNMFCRVVRQPRRSERTLPGCAGEAGPGERAAVWGERETSCRWRENCQQALPGCCTLMQHLQAGLRELSKPSPRKEQTRMGWRQDGKCWRTYFSTRMLKRKRRCRNWRCRGEFTEACRNHAGYGVWSSGCPEFPTTGLE